MEGVTAMSRLIFVLNRFKKVEEAPATLKVIVMPGPAFPGEHFEDTLWVLPETAAAGWEEGQFQIPSYLVDSLQVRKEGSV